MDIVVIKKNGRREKFDKGKIRRALKRAGMKRGSEKIAASVEKKLAGEKEVHSGSIRDMVTAELHELDHKLEECYSSFRKTMRKLSEGEQFMENRLAHIAGKHGDVRCVYGGFHINISEPESFDYAGVFMELLKSNHTVRVELVDGKLRIVTK